jgi:hypothetical protein
VVAAVSEVPDVTGQKMAVGAGHRFSLRACVSPSKKRRQVPGPLLFCDLMSRDQYVTQVRRYLRWLFEAKKRFGLSVLNYMVTSNHVHFLVKDTGRHVSADYAVNWRTS